MGREDNIVTFNLDGSETPQKQGTSKMEWKGDKFVATVISAHGGGENGGNSITFYREGAWLVVEEPPHGGTVLTKMYYAKAAPAKFRSGRCASLPPIRMKTIEFTRKAT